MNTPLKIFMSFSCIEAGTTPMRYMNEILQRSFEILSAGYTPVYAPIDSLIPALHVAEACDYYTEFREIFLPECSALLVVDEHHKNNSDISAAIEHGIPVFYSMTTLLFAKPPAS